MGSKNVMSQKNGKVSKCTENLQHFLFGAIRADDILVISNETLADQTYLTCSAEEAIVVPVTIFERNEFSAADSSDWFVASETSLGEKFAKTFGAKRFVVAAGKSFTGQTFVAVCASEALPMPWFVLVGYSSSSDDLIAFNASGCEFFFVTFSTIDFLFPWDETLGSYWYFAYATTETFFVPLPSFIFHFLGPSTENLVATIAFGSKLVVVAASTIDPIALRTKLSIY